MSLKEASVRVAKALEAAGIRSEIVVFPQSTKTAHEAAAAVGADVGQIVKSLVFMAGRDPVLLLVSGSNRVAVDKVSAILGTSVTRADAETVRRVTGFAIGGVPPLGHDTPMTTLIDRDLMQYDTVWAAAGTPNSVFAISPQDLVRATSGRVVDLKED